VLVTSSTMVDRALSGEMIGTWFDANPVASGTADVRLTNERK